MSQNPQQKLNCILMVDDDEACNFLQRFVVEEKDCAEEIKVVRDGVEAIEYMQKALEGKEPKPELIFLDINMPRMDGWGFLKEYEKLTSDTPDSVIVMLTSSINPDDRKRAEQISLVNKMYNKILSEDALEEILTTNFPDKF